MISQSSSSSSSSSASASAPSSVATAGKTHILRIVQEIKKRKRKEKRKKKERERERKYQRERIKGNEEGMADNASEGLLRRKTAFLHAVEAQRAASDFINNLVITAAMCYTSTIRNREVPFLSRRSISDMLGIVNWLNLVRDNGESHG